MSVSVKPFRPVKAITLPSDDQIGLCSLVGVRETLYGGFEPSIGKIWISRLKSSSSYDATIHLPSGDQSYSTGENDFTSIFGFLPLGSMIQSSPRSLRNATYFPSGLQVRRALVAPSSVSGVSVNF